MLAFKYASKFALALLVVVAIGCGDDDPVVTPPAPDTKAPTVLSVAPADSATNVPTNTSIVVTFSENMDPNAGAGVFLTPNPGGLLSTTIIGDVVTLMYTNPLAAGTEHTVTVTTAVEDEAGNSLETEFTSTFTTAAPKPVIVLYDQGQGTQTNGVANAFNNNDDPFSNKLADNFQLALPSTITQVEWTASKQGLNGTVVEWLVEIYAAQAGTPGDVDTLICSESFLHADANENNLTFSSSRYSVTLTTPVALDPSTTYWLAINPDMGGQPGFSSWLRQGTDGVTGTVGDGIFAQDPGADGTWSSGTIGTPGSDFVFTIRGREE